MKVGVWIPSVRRFASNENIRASILQAERLGYDSHLDHRPRHRADRRLQAVRPRLRPADRDGARGRPDRAHPDRRQRPGAAVPPRRADGQDARLAGRPQQRPHHPRRRVRLERRRERHPAPAVRGARPDDRRVHSDHEGALDQSQPELRGRLHQLLRRRVPAAARPEGRAADLGRRQQPGPPCAAPPSLATPGTRSTSRRTSFGRARPRSRGSASASTAPSSRRSPTGPTPGSSSTRIRSPNPRTRGRRTS